MCGITAILHTTHTDARIQALDMSRKLRHRGPDASGVYQDEHAILVHERLSIVDIEHGAQPLIDSTTGRVLIANGEIYTHEELRRLLKKDHAFHTASDSEVLLYLYDEYGPAMMDMLEGIYAFIIYDPRDQTVFVARDHIGIVPLYWGTDKHGQLCFSSELKGLEGYCEEISLFPPGHYYDGKLHTWYSESWMTEHPTQPAHPSELREHLEVAVKQQLMSDAPLGVLISGGLDSSIIASLAKQHVDELHSFSIGLKGSPDTEYAKKVAAHIGTIHHDCTFTEQEGIDALSEVIYHLETYDVTTIRASTPMYLMSRYIGSLGIKVVLSGEGADELFGGYLYFHMAPDSQAFHEETVRKVADLHKYDCLRANKSTMAWGVEARVPFLSKKLISYVMSVDPSAKMCIGGIEKHFLRTACEDLLPQEVAWRQKEQFSDGVGYSWIDSIKELAERTISDRELADAHLEFELHTPDTKEALLYRRIFAKHFPSEAAARTVPFVKSIACSTPTALEWSEAFQGMEDPTGRAVAVHAAAVQKI